MKDRKHSQEGDYLRIAKTNQCLWCGSSEAYGTELRQRRPLSPTYPIKFECVDSTACERRIKNRILVGPGSFPR